MSIGLQPSAALAFPPTPLQVLVVGTGFQRREGSLLRKEVQDETSPTSSCTGWLPIAPPNPLSTLFHPALCLRVLTLTEGTDNFINMLSLWLLLGFGHWGELASEGVGRA